MSCVNNENENTEIFVNPQWQFPYCFNISNSVANDSHPKLFYNYINYRNYTHLFWESSRNGYIQIFMCENWFTVNTEEKIENNNSLITSPNPCNDHLNIEYSILSPSHVSLSIFNELGQCIRQFTSTKKSMSENYMTWDLKNSYGNKVVPGTYFIHLLVDNKTSINKVVIQ